MDLNKKSLLFAMFVLGCICMHGAYGSFSAKEYFPLEINDEWKFEDPIVAGSLNPRVRTGPVINGVNTKYLNWWNGQAPLVYRSFGPEYYSNDLNGLRMHRNYISVPNVPTGPTDGTYTPPIKLLHPTFEIGDTLQSAGTAVVRTNPPCPPDCSGGQVFRVAFSATSQVETMEQTTVPRGSFETLRIRVTISYTGTVNGVSQSLTVTTTVWLTRYLGIVRRTQDAPQHSTDCAGGSCNYDARLVSARVDFDNDDRDYFNDNCPGHANRAQTDGDGDGNGDVCDAFPRNPDETADTDNDGMGDNFEKRFGLNPEDSSDANLDPDLDGLTNLEEFERGMNPHLNEGAVMTIINAILN